MYDINIISIITLVIVGIYSTEYEYVDRSLRFPQTFNRHLTLLILHRPILLTVIV